MLMSKIVLQTVKETPGDVKIASHALLMRSGFIKSVANGIFTLTSPAAVACRNIENIIREEMNALGGQEVLFPVVMPRELWESSGRYDSIGSEMVRFKDRGNKDMLLGMTHEEAAVHLINNTVSSYAQFPSMIYQIQTKFRDEPRCRGGLIRVREFTMKDAYSFHMTKEDLDEFYYKMLEAYNRIFRRVGLKKFISVRSDTGMMGGSVAHEFMLLTPVGEDTLVLCDKCGYKANMEVAECVDTPASEEDMQELQEVFTGEAKTIEEVCDFLHMPVEKSVKAVVYAIKGDKERTVVAFVRGDGEVNEAKLRQAVKANIAVYEGGCEGIVPGNIGPVNLDRNITVIVDKGLKGCRNMVVGANKDKYHYTGFCIDRDLDAVSYCDIAKVRDGDICPVCGGPLHLENGIEIGNIFQLGTKYTESMNVTVLNNEGKLVYPIMGCYGIGIGRLLASIVEESNDEYGMILPVTIAPYKVHLCALRVDEEEVRAEAERLYKGLMDKGIAVLYDDRDISAGVKFADADLLGMPLRVVVSPKNLKKGELELTFRKDRTSRSVPVENGVRAIEEAIAELGLEYNI